MTTTGKVGHSIEWTISHDHLAWTIRCENPPGSGCNTFCREESCEETGVLSESDGEGGFRHPYEHEDDNGVLTNVWHTTHVDGCTISDWIDNSDGAATCYAGEKTPVRDGPILLTWEGDDWSWTYADREALS